MALRSTAGDDGAGTAKYLAHGQGEWEAKRRGPEMKGGAPMAAQTHKSNDSRDEQQAK